MSSDSDDNCMWGSLFGDDDSTLSASHSLADKLNATDSATTPTTKSWQSTPQRQFHFNGNSLQFLTQQLTALQSSLQVCPSNHFVRLAELQREILTETHSFTVKQQEILNEQMS